MRSNLVPTNLQYNNPIPSKVETVLSSEHYLYPIAVLRITESILKILDCTSPMPIAINLLFFYTLPNLFLFEKLCCLQLPQIFPYLLRAMDYTWILFSKAASVFRFFQNSSPYTIDNMQVQNRTNIPATSHKNMAAPTAFFSPQFP